MRCCRHEAAFQWLKALARVGTLVTIQDVLEKSEEHWRAEIETKEGRGLQSKPAILTHELYLQLHRAVRSLPAAEALLWRFTLTKPKLEALTDAVLEAFWHASGLYASRRSLANHTSSADLHPYGLSGPALARGERPVQKL